VRNLLDVEDLAKYLKLQKQTIYNWLNQRKITGIKIGGVGALISRKSISGLNHRLEGLKKESK